MLFNSYVFLLVFFPLTFFTYFLLNRLKYYKIAQLSLVVMSLIFYAYFHLSYLLIILFSITVNYLMSRTMVKFQTYRRLVLILGIILNVGIIFYFKYFDFFIRNVNAVFGLSINVLNILMPLGISFFTFQQISFLVDSYRGETKGYSFLEYSLYVSFFPQLIAGPIVLHDEMIPQFRDIAKKNVNLENLSQGIYRLSVGLAKKVLLADTLAKGVDWGYQNYATINGADLLLVAFLYSFQLYFDFSGYCDMACGIAKCLNFELPENFLSPYKATSIRDFWRRWHITLSRFLTKYIYIPLGGGHKGTFRKTVNILIIFAISGIWHGANWTFVVWGLIHGFAYILYSFSRNLWDKLLKPLRIGINFCFVTFAWIFFRAENLQVAADFIRGICIRPSLKLSDELLRKFDITELTYIESHINVLRRLVEKVPELNLCIIATICLFIVFAVKNCSEKKIRFNWASAIACGVLLTWSTLSLSGISTFLYFNF